MNAWEGLTGIGAPESGMAYFPETATPEELIALAWLLEEGSRTFYAAMPSLLEDATAATLFQDLANAEEHHKKSLDGLYSDLTGTAFPKDLPGSLRSPGTAAGDDMEGGVKVSEALAWAHGQSVNTVLQFGISLEANAYDLYIKMGRSVNDAKAKKVFSTLCAEEQKHLSRFADLLDRKS